MTKTAPLTYDTHKYLKWLQAILYNKYNIDMHIRDILDYIIKDAEIKDAEKVAKKIVESILNKESIEGKKIEGEKRIEKDGMIIIEGQKIGD